MSEWKEYRLGEVCIYNTERIPLNLLNEENYISTENMLPNIGGVTISSNLPTSGNAVHFYNGDILISNIRPYFKKIWYANKEGGCSADVLCIRANKDIDKQYLYYLLSQQDFFDYVMAGAKGCKMPRGDKQHIMNWEISLPSLPTQQKIANILSSLDDKIEVNRRINEQLEELAQALFKSWFVDFEPFKDGEFVESELGMIPKGWKVCELSEIGDIIGGATPSKSNEDYYTENGISWITPKDLSINKNKFIDKGETDITEIGYSKCSAKLMPRGSVLFSSRAPIGYIAIAKNELCTNQGFKSVVPKIAGTAFIYFYLKNNVSNIESMASGSTFKEASGTLMKSLKVIIPPSNLLQAYEEKISSIFKKQEYLEEEITHLTTLRDTLLPKLMSGEMDVNERGIERT